MPTSSQHWPCFPIFLSFPPPSYKVSRPCWQLAPPLVQFLLHVQCQMQTLCSSKRVVFVLTLHTCKMVVIEVLTQFHQIVCFGSFACHLPVSLPLESRARWQNLSQGCYLQQPEEHVGQRGATKMLVLRKANLSISTKFVARLKICLFMTKLSIYMWIVSPNSNNIIFV